MPRNRRNLEILNENIRHLPAPFSRKVINAGDVPVQIEALGNFVDIPQCVVGGARFESSFVSGGCKDVLVTKCQDFTFFVRYDFVFRGARPASSAIASDDSMIGTQSIDNNSPGLLLRKCHLREDRYSKADTKTLSIRLHS
jgi:hypothetical protein